MRKKGKKHLRLASAIMLSILGVLGCIIPVIPGIPLLLVGIYLFSPQKFNYWFHRLTCKCTPRTQHRLRKFLEKFKRK